MVDFHGKKLIWLMTLENSLDKSDKQIKRVYGRRQGRPLNPARKEAFERLMPKIGISSDDLTENASLCPSSLFDKEHNATWLEIGFGAGEHVKALMEQHRDIGFLGAEPFLNGMTSFLKSLDPEDETQVRVLMDDAMMLVRSLKDNSLERLYILNPDPWHKKRHHKRRIVNPDNLDEFARVLKPDSQLIMTTDVPYLAEWMCTAAVNHPAFRWTAKSATDWKKAPTDWIPTRYEVKGAKGADQMCYLFFERI